MKKISISLLPLLAVVCVSLGQNPSSPRVTAESKNVKVEYGQPSKRGRVIFGELLPYGEVWRTGANQATEITFAKDGTFGGKPVKKGTYTLFTIPAAREWTIILNSQLGQFGAFEYDQHKSKNVLEVLVASRKTQAVVEKLSIRPSDTALVIEWDTTSVSIPMKF
ncbi:MAG: FIG00650431: hypothetical protein [uncultured Cytophagales bacterium]|uniref:DUF2911 domain-containing protein n=1 Tax=uncultured Cytophagales bacterium TaxID=158755 RepID=A0A6J4KUX4_9SPHI|nr:MAG: FIG00650431: hypothetical protein [uncultured Cytophagales bacterium]